MKNIFPNELICSSSVTGSLDMCILKFKKCDFVRLIFSFKKFQEIEKDLFFWVSKIAFQLVISQYIKNHLSKIVYLPHYGKL